MVTIVRTMTMHWSEKRKKMQKKKWNKEKREVPAVLNAMFYDNTHSDLEAIINSSQSVQFSSWRINFCVFFFFKSFCFIFALFFGRISVCWKKKEEKLRFECTFQWVLRARRISVWNALNGSFVWCVNNFYFVSIEAKFTKYFQQWK